MRVARIDYLKAIVASCAIAFGSQANAGVLFAFEETGDGVVGTLSGSLDLSTANYLTTTSYPTLGGFIGPASGFLGTVTSGGSVDFYEIVDRVSFGTGGIVTNGTPTGDFFTLDGIQGLDAVGLPVGYQSNDPLSATLTFAGATFASLGITPGTYVMDLAVAPPGDPVIDVALAPEGSVFVVDPSTFDNSITLVFGEIDSVIPLPAGLPLLLAGLGGLALLRRKKTANA